MSNPRRSLTVLAAIAASGGMSFFSAGIHHHAALAWIAAVPVLVVLLDLGRAGAALAAFAASAIGALSFALAYPDLPWALRAAAIPFFAVPFTLVATSWRAIARRSSPPLAVAAYAALVVSAEYLLSLVSPHGTLGSLAYTQGDFPAVLQVASVTGAWGVSFLIAMVSAGLAVAWRHRREQRTAATALSVALCPLVLALASGALRLQRAPPTEHVEVGLVVSDVDYGRNFEADTSARALPVVAAYVDRACAVAKEGAQIVVMPEKFVGVTPDYEGAARALLAKAARECGLTIIAGLHVASVAERRNVALAIRPDGTTALEYDKQHLVPGLEDGYRRGDGVGSIQGMAPAMGVAICKDLDFTSLARVYGRSGVRLLLVPAWDFVADGWLHSRVAVLRGVEGGFAVARCAAQGLLTASDAYGRIVTERASGAAPEVRLVASLAVGPGNTLYVRLGDWFAWLCLSAVAACVAVHWTHRGRPLPRA